MRPRERLSSWRSHRSTGCGTLLTETGEEASVNPPLTMLIAHDPGLDEAGPVLERVAVRAVICRGGEVLLMRTGLGDHKFPVVAARWARASTRLCAGSFARSAASSTSRSGIGWPARSRPRSP